MPTSLRLALSALLPDRALAYRDGLVSWPGAAQLRASIQRLGVLQPIVVAAVPEGLRLVAGFRRVAVLEELGVAEVLATVNEHEDIGALFLRALEEHAGQPVNPREIARALRAGLSLGWPLAQAAERLLPALGLRPHPALAERYLRLLELPPSLLDELVSKAFSLRRSLLFCRLTPAEAELLAEVARRLRLGGRQLEQLCIWLLEVAAREQRTVSAIIEELGLREAPSAEEALARLEARRLPEASRRREELDHLCHALANGRIEVRYDRDFAREGVELLLRAREAGELRELVTSLGDPLVVAQLEQILARLWR